MNGYGVEVYAAAGIGAGEHAGDGREILPQVDRPVDEPHPCDYPDGRSDTPQQKEQQHRPARPADTGQIDVEQQKKDRQWGQVAEDTGVDHRARRSRGDESQIGNNGYQQNHHQRRTQLPQYRTPDQPLRRRHAQAKDGQHGQWLGDHATPTLAPQNFCFLPREAFLIQNAFFFQFSQSFDSGNEVV